MKSIGRNSGINRVFERKYQDKPPFYCLKCTPPKRQMHMGHVKELLIGDAVARYKECRASKFCTQWDMIHSECLQKMLLSKGTIHMISLRNMNSITQQIKRMGFSYDWRRMIKSHDPKYTSGINIFSRNFLKMASRSIRPVNWWNVVNCISK